MDEVDVESLLLTDDGLGFRRPGVSLDVLGQLRKGKWAIQDQLDLHGLRRDSGDTSAEDPAVTCPVHGRKEDASSA